MLINNTGSDGFESTNNSSSLEQKWHLVYNFGLSINLL